ncbi:MAG: hypothetical protein GW947_00955 [Candidatus Pacebacteria bacterium]|nr:hypothetical protein [Candidatus Paceibacterota bacterium]
MIRNIRESEGSATDITNSAVESNMVAVAMLETAGGETSEYAQLLDKLDIPKDHSLRQLDSDLVPVEQIITFLEKLLALKQATEPIAIQENSISRQRISIGVTDTSQEVRNAQQSKIVDELVKQIRRQLSTKLKSSSIRFTQVSLVNAISNQDIRNEILKLEETTLVGWIQELLLNFYKDNLHFIRTHNILIDNSFLFRVLDKLGISYLSHEDPRNVLKQDLVETIVAAISNKIESSANDTKDDDELDLDTELTVSPYIH